MELGAGRLMSSTGSTMRFIFGLALGLLFGRGGSVRKASTPPPTNSSADAAAERRQSLQDQKHVAFYESAVNAWIASAMELDKSLLTLASGAIGLSLTLVEPLKGSVVFVVLYIVANALFLTTVIAALAALQFNKDYIKSVVLETPVEDWRLAACDWVARWSFGIGALLLMVVGVVSVVAGGKG